MTIKDLRRLKQLSEIPTHSPESLEELQELVRILTAAYLDERDDKCSLCANTHECHKIPGSEMWRNCYWSVSSRNFELRIDSEGGD